VFLSACSHAALAGLGGQAGSGVSAAEGEEQAARATGMLHKAVGMGYRKAIAFRAEAALGPLRGREDFSADDDGSGHAGRAVLEGQRSRPLRAARPAVHPHR
jgi:hypothetical protein